MIQTERKTNENRENLKQLSEQVRPLMEEGKYPTVNAAIMATIYQNPENIEFKTFHQWKREGKTITKGAKAYPVWGQPIQAAPKDGSDPYDFFPLCYLFSNAQVREPLAEYGGQRVAEVQVSYQPTIPVAQLQTITTVKDAVKILRGAWPESMCHIENFYLLLLNRASKVLGYAHISKGGMTGTVADIKVILQIALKTNASSIIIAHNHPSGSTKASQEDRRLTARIQEACKILDMQLFDHIILTQDDYVSFSESGIL